jgi:predicted DNA-binding protein
MPRRSSVVHSDLRLLDLAPKHAEHEVLLSIRLPNELLNRLDRLCLALGARKSEVVTATLNEGLQRYEASRVGLGVRRRPSKARAAERRA